MENACQTPKTAAENAAGNTAANATGNALENAMNGLDALAEKTSRWGFEQTGRMQKVFNAGMSLDVMGDENLMKRSALWLMRQSALSQYMALKADVDGFCRSLNQSGEMAAAARVLGQCVRIAPDYPPPPASGCSLDDGEWVPRMTDALSHIGSVADEIDSQLCAIKARLQEAAA